MARKFSVRGDMKSLITFQRNAAIDSQNKDDRGQLIDDWQDFKCTRAKRERLSGNKLLAAREVHHLATDRFVLQFQDIRLGDRIVSYGKVYEILDIDNYLDCNRELHVLAGAIR